MHLRHIIAAIAFTLVGIILPAHAEATADHTTLAAKAEKIAGAPLPETARDLSAFKNFKPDVTVAEVFLKVGAPDKDNGLGRRHIYVWRLSDGSEIWAATADNKKFWYLDYVVMGAREKRFFGPSDISPRPGRMVGGSGSSI